MLEDLILAVPGDASTLDHLIDVLADVGLVGWVIDGARLGHDGWLLARVAADDEGALAMDAAGDLHLLETGDLQQLLNAVWPEAQVGDVVINGAEVAGPVCQSFTAPLHEVAVARAKGMGLEFEAVMEHVSLAELEVADRVVFARTQPIAGKEHELLETFTSAKGGSVVLWRRDPHVMLAVLQRSELAELHVFEPEWTPFGGVAQRHLRADIVPSTADPARIVELLDLPTESTGKLQALLAAHEPAVDELCEVLQLPAEAARVIAGECAVEDLPGAVTHLPTETDSPRSSPWWHIGISLFALVILVGTIVDGVAQDSLVWTLIGILGTIVVGTSTVVEVRRKLSAR